MPSPNSALSSKRLLAHAGPLPLSSLKYGLEGYEPPYMLEQPVALAINIFSPKSMVASLMYGVSPQPPQAPEKPK